MAKQVQIRLMGEDSKWFQPHQVPAFLEALRAVGEDIEQYSGSYTDKDLRKFRDAMSELDTLIERQLKARRRHHTHADDWPCHDQCPAWRAVK